MIDKINVSFKEQDFLSSIEELVIDCTDLQNSISIIEDLNFTIEEISSLKEKDLLQKISEQRTIIKSTQAINEMMKKKLLHLNEELLKEKKQ